MNTYEMSPMIRNAYEFLQKYSKEQGLNSVYELFDKRISFETLPSFILHEVILNKAMGLGYVIPKELRESTPYGAIVYTNIIHDLVGQTVEAIVNKNDRELTFILSDETECTFYHEQDCCETVEIEDICGNLEDLLNSPITMAEEVVHQPLNYNDEMAKDESTTYTFYKFATVKGYVTVRWCGSSNGYYSERVDFKVEHPQKEMTM